MDFQIDPRTQLSNATPSLQSDRKTRDLESLKESTKEFEAIFVMEMLKAMRKAVPEGGLFPKTQAVEIFEEMIDMETARAATEGAGLGLADAMYRQMADMIDSKK